MVEIKGYRVVKYNKCVYKWNFSELYVIPLKYYNKKGIYKIQTIVVGGAKPMTFWEVGGTIEFGSFKNCQSIKEIETLFNANYSPYFSEGDLLKYENSFTLIESIERFFCYTKNFSSGGRCTRIDVQLPIPLSYICEQPFKIVQKIPKQEIPELILAGRTIWTLCKNNAHYVIYRSTNGGSFGIVKPAMLNFINNFNICFINGCLIESHNYS